MPDQSITTVTYRAPHGAGVSTDAAGRTVLTADARIILANRIVADAQRGPAREALDAALTRYGIDTVHGGAVARQAGQVVYRGEADFPVIDGPATVRIDGDVITLTVPDHLLVPDEDFWDDFGSTYLGVVLTATVIDATAATVTALGDISA